MKEPYKALFVEHNVNVPRPPANRAIAYPPSLAPALCAALAGARLTVTLAIDPAGSLPFLAVQGPAQTGPLPLPARGAHPGRERFRRRATTHRDPGSLADGGGSDHKRDVAADAGSRSLAARSQPVTVS